MATQVVIQPDPSDDQTGYCLLGALKILEQVEELRKQARGASKNEDVECVHKLRVASRRLRVTLRVFSECMPKREFKRWVKGIKQVTRFAGAARDADVQISFLTSSKDNFKDTDVQSAIEYLISLKREGRAAVQLDIIAGLDKLIKEGIIDEMREWSKTTEKRCQHGADGRTDGAVIKSQASYYRSCHQIVSRLDDLLALEMYVHDEGAVLKHHELRIAAKWLRYTMETFSVLYAGGLNDKISLIKQFQDMLGEVHDLDVWADFLKGHRAVDNQQEIRSGLDKFSKFISEERASHYRKFVSLWDSVAEKFPDEIRAVAGVDSQYGMIAEFLKSASKVALISDIHGNIDALLPVMDDARELGIEVFLNAGDSVGFGPDPEGVVETIRSSNTLSVMGNFDLKVVEGRQKGGGDKDVAVMFAVNALSTSSCSYLRSLPKDLRLEVGGKQLFVTHGSPSSMEEHIYQDSPKARLNAIALLAKSDVLVMGHSHRQFSLEAGKTMLINPGSVGRPDDGDPRAEYAIITLDPISVEFRRVSYDVESLAHSVRKKGLPESFAQMFLRGVSLEAVKEEERSISEKELWKNSSTIRVVKRVASKYGPVNHAKQDQKLALSIFDQLKEVHHLGTRERFWLQCGSILHDVGQSRGMKGHNKSSLRLILNDIDLPFTFNERYIVGSIARYHRRALPKKRHYNFAPLGKDERRIVAILSSIVRVADALDFSHKSIVKKLDVKVLPTCIIIECYISGDKLFEEQAVNKKKDLFEKVFKRDLVIQWRTPTTG